MQKKKCIGREVSTATLYPYPQQSRSPTVKCHPQVSAQKEKGS
jgi:hypothetical protein